MNVTSRELEGILFSDEQINYGIKQAIEGTNPDESDLPVEQRLLMLCRYLHREGFNKGMLQVQNHIKKGLCL